MSPKQKLTHFASWKVFSIFFLYLKILNHIFFQILLTLFLSMGFFFTFFSKFSNLIFTKCKNQKQKILSQITHKKHKIECISRFTKSRFPDTITSIGITITDIRGNRNWPKFTKSSTSWYRRSKYGTPGYC